MNQKWDHRFLALAEHISQWSRDPSTRVGAVIVNEQRRIISVGYNGLAQGVKDSPERYENRELKLKLIVHAEMNALAFAQRDLTGCTLYAWPFMPCSRCASMVIQHGIKRVVAPEASSELQERWREDLALTQVMFEEVGIVLEIVNLPPPTAGLRPRPHPPSGLPALDCFEMTREGKLWPF
jgi:dCMP deaminase